MGQALYRKYRSMSLDEILGQEHITGTLSQALKSGRISHAYLFSGPHGVGKTSIARILAHAINGLPYTDDSAHLDIIETDAASNRGIDEIRDLREKVYVAPTSGTYKVYIIDEVHMLTTPAFNALLKTLEEPPAHVVFILATTEAHKLPETIISRTQHYTFKPVEPAKVMAHLREIAAAEHIAINDDALALLASRGGGSFRDSISLLDQAGSLTGQAEIGVAAIRRLLGIAPDEVILRLIEHLHTAGSASDILAMLGQLYAQGLQAANIASQLADRLRTSLMDKTPLFSHATALSLLKQLIEVPASRSPERYLEIILMEAAEQMIPSVPTPQSAALSKAPAAPKTAKAALPGSLAKQPPQPQQSAVSASEAPQEAADTSPAPSADSQTGAAAAIIQLDGTVWPRVLDGIKKQHNTLYGVLRMAHPIFSETSIELQCNFVFHQKRLNEAKNRKLIAGFIRQVTGRDVAVECTVHKPTTAKVAASGTKQMPVVQVTPPVALETISNIFGGGELLE